MLRVCVAALDRDLYSETFVRAHVRKLPAETTFVYGRPFPKRHGDGAPLARARWWRRAGLDDLLRRRRIQIVLAEFGPAGVAMIDACRRARIPLAVHFHGYDAHKVTVVAEQAEGYRRLWTAADAIIVASSSMARAVLQIGAPPALVRVQPLGIDLAQFAPTHADKNPPHFFAAGRFVDKKAPHLTLVAFSKVFAQAADARLTMAGDGPLLESCRLLADALGLSNVVTFPGALPPEAIARHMHGARAFVQHSLVTSDGDSEGFGLVFVEAGASALPVVATRHDGIPEIVLDGETGFLVEERDVGAMAERMSRLLRDPGLAAELGSAARRRCEALFDERATLAGLAGLLAELVKTRGKA